MGDGDRNVPGPPPRRLFLRQTSNREGVRSADAAGVVPRAARREKRRRDARRRLLRVVTVAVVVIGAASIAMLWPTSHTARNQAGAHKVAKVGSVVHNRRPFKSRAVRFALPRPLPRRTLRVPILMYHRVGPSGARTTAMTRALTVPAAVFGAQMRWLERNGFHAITQVQLFDALEHGARLPKRPVMITFDDGYRDVLWNAAPVLARLRFPATAYVITGRVSGSDPSFLTWDELRALERLGIAIGSHTVDHLELTGLSDVAALFQLAASRRALEAHLHHPVQWFSYPAGRSSVHLLPLVARAGYVLAVTTSPGVVQAAAAPYGLHRYRILQSTGVSGLAALLAAR